LFRPVTAQPPEANEQKGRTHDDPCSCSKQARLD
jgi:hypothetical protein